MCPRPECESNKRKIPLPKEVFDHEVFPVAIVGASSSGKTYYLTALMNEFVENPIWDGDYWRLEMVHYANDMEHESIDNRFVEHWRALFRNRTPLRNTQTNEYLSPLLLSVEYFRRGSKNWLFREPLLKRKQLLVFHDVPGEFTTSDDARMALTSRYGVLGAAKGIIVLVEPKELPLLRAELVGRHKIPNMPGGGFAQDAIKGLRVAKQHRKPVAVCLSKADLFLDIPSVVEQDSHLAQYKQTADGEAGCLQLNDIAEVSSYVRNIFERFDGDDILSLLDKSFHYSSLFAVSSLGEGVVDSFSNSFKRDARIRPLRVMDPILWMLWQHGLLNGVS